MKCSVMTCVALHTDILLLLFFYLFPIFLFVLFPSSSFFFVMYLILTLLSVISLFLFSLLSAPIYFCVFVAMVSSGIAMMTFSLFWT